MPKPLKLILCGAAGRMGREIAELAEWDPRFTIVGGIDRVTPFPRAKFQVAGPEHLGALLPDADVLIDFSLPEGSTRFVAAAARARKPAVVGTTGFSPAQFKKLKAASRRVPVLYAPNMSPGMNLLFDLARRAAAALPGYDAVISETHHTRKVDAPSGSAKRIGEAVRSATKRAVPTVSLRAGGVVGDHTLLLAGPDERLEITHRAQSRSAFARGALEAAVWVRRKKPGFYGMLDVLRLS